MFLQEPYDDECFECMARDDKIDDIKYWFNAVLDQLFGVDEFNTLELLRYLNEITNTLSIQFPDKPLAVVRENRTVALGGLLDAWKIDANKYLNNLAKTGT